MEKTLVFDMDGTVVDFYGVNGWLTDLQNSNPRPYIVAEPKFDMDLFNAIIAGFKALGWKIIFTTWLAKNSNKEFDRMVRNAKLDWLDRYNVEYDEIHLVKYGTTKANCTRKIGGYQILVDDNETVRKGWTLGNTINANENVLAHLCDLLNKEL